jgi:serine/threonine-protein kinase
MMDALQAQLAAAADGGYEIERELGGGGMSRVFIATERALRRRVAIKVLAGIGVAIDPRRFRREIMLSAGLQHPHIVPVHAAGEVAGLPFFVMPLVEGESLRQRLARGGALPTREAMRALRDIASALQYAHARGIVHRDLKPENVMISGGSAMVLDFGVAKALAARDERIPEPEEGTPASPSPHSLTTAGMTLGTPRYMAPEQAAGDPALDHRADIYSFGVLAFEVLAGAPPFTGSASEVLRKHLVEPPPDLGALRSGLPRSLVALVAACLAKDPRDRPQRANELVDALDGEDLPLVRARSARRGGAPLPPRGPWAEALAVPAVYALAAGGALATMLHLSAEDRVREGLVAAAVIGSLLGLPIAIAGGLLLRVVARERRG